MILTATSARPLAAQFLELRSALQFQGSATDKSTNNAADYLLTTGTPDRVVQQCRRQFHPYGPAAAHCHPHRP